MITTLDQMVEKVTGSGRRYRIAVTWGQDSNTLGALSRAVKSGFASAVLLGQEDKIISVCSEMSVDPGLFDIIDVDDEIQAASLSVEMVRDGRADILMKGLVGTDKFLKAVIDKEKGLLAPGSLLSYVCAIQLPSYHKLLFVTDTAVLPYPDLNQKISMAGYSIGMARQFGIEKPKIALIGASEKPSRHFSYSDDYQAMCAMAREGRFGDCVMDGPLDLFLACDPGSVIIKGVDTPVGGDADILLFPSLEACNPFYKGLMLFSQGELAGMLAGTTRPVILMSRSESENSKYYCIALSCLMADAYEKS